MGGRGQVSQSSKFGEYKSEYQQLLGSSYIDTSTDVSRKHEKYLNGELGTKITKNDEFNMEYRFPDMDYSRTKWSKNEDYIRANRVSKDESHIAVQVTHSMVYETKYGYALHLDEKHVQYLRDWQVVPQRLPYKGEVGVNVLMSKQYFNPKETKNTNYDYAYNAQNLSWSTWVKTAKSQQKIGNTVMY